MLTWNGLIVILNELNINISISSSVSISNLIGINRHNPQKEHVLWGYQ